MPAFHYDDKQEIYYELYGAEGDPVLTIVNGLSMRTSHWAPYFELLPKAGVRVLTYDMLGQGQSSKPILGVSFEDHAHTLKALHDHLGIEKPYVLGISFGGVVALKYAVLYPDGLKGLVPISTFSELDPQLVGHANNLYIGMSRIGFEFYLDLLMPLNFSNSWLSKNQQLIEVIKRVGVSTNELFGIQNLMESLRDFQPITPELSAIRAPTLILNGEYDVLTPRHLHDLIRQAIPSSRLVIVPHMCHAFTLEVPELTTRLLADFINSVERGKWRGDQSVWIANDDLQSDEVAIPYPPVDHLRFITLPSKALEPVAAEPAPARESALSPAPEPKADSAPAPVSEPESVAAPAKRRASGAKRGAGRQSAKKAAGKAASAKSGRTRTVKA